MVRALHAGTTASVPVCKSAAGKLMAFIQYAALNNELLEPDIICLSVNI